MREAMEPTASISNGGHGIFGNRLVSAKHLVEVRLFPLIEAAKSYLQ